MIRQNNSNRMNHRSRTNTSRNGGDSDNRGRNMPSRNAHEQTSNNGRVRGNPRQLREKYLTLAQEAISTGNIIDAETYYQYADHYYRLSRDEYGQNGDMKRQGLFKEQFPEAVIGDEQKFLEVDQEVEVES
jgi:hypothetical protein